MIRASKGPGVARTHPVELDHGQRSGVVLGEPAVQLDREIGYVSVVMHVDDELGVSGIGILGRDREVEARRAGAHEARHIDHALVGEQLLLHRRETGSAILDARALGQPDIDHELAHRGVGKEQLLDMAEADDGRYQQSDRPADGEEAKANGLLEEAAKHLEEAVVVRVLAGFFRRRKHGDALQWGQRHRDHPADQERDRDHGEQRPAVLARILDRGEDGIEGHHGDDRRAQQGNGRLGGGLDRRLGAVHALLQAH